MRQLLFFLLFLISVSTNAQKLTGVVRDASTGIGIPFVNVFIPNSSFGTNTDEEGEFDFAPPRGKNEIHFSTLTYEKYVLQLNLTQDTFVEIFLIPTDIEIGEVTVEAKKTRIGNRIIRNLIANKDQILTEKSTFSNDNYIKTEIERYRPASKPEDTIVVEEGYDLVYLSEIATRQHLSNGKYKAEVKAELVNSSDDKLQRRARMDIDRSFRGSGQGIEYNPIEFFRNPQEANIELYDNQINNPTLSDRPISSPLGNGAFLNYRFRLKEISIVDGDSIFRVSVEPIFKKAPLFTGEITVNGSNWVLESASLSIDDNVITAFSDFTFDVKYEAVGDGKYKATNKSFFYVSKINKAEYRVNTQIVDSEFDLKPAFSKNFFSNEIIKYSEKSLERDVAIWEELRPKNIHVKQEERAFIMERDSIWDYEHSEEYYNAQDSDYNKITILNVLWSGVNYRKKSRGLTLYFASIAESVRPLGVGGYRQSLTGSVEKEFSTNNSLGFAYDINYGFTNNDLKGSLRVGYTYLPQKFARVFASVGDTYDLITIYESLQNIISRGNYIRNQRFSVGHVFEVVNGLYFTGEVKYADKRSIEDITLSGWTDFIFGEANQPRPFERYRSFIFEADILYKFGQKYITRGRKKIVLGNNYPTLNLKYKKGIPSIGNSEVNFDHIEVRLSQEMPLTKFGNTNWLILGGKYLNKRNLRFIEYKYFRGSTPYLFADPLRDYQLLGPTLSTNNAYFQAMGIHHFNGFVMDKIPLVNYLQLELIAGAAALAIPDQNFLHAEFYAGLGRKFKLFGEQFQIAAYATTRDNSLEKFQVSYKFGVNFYNAFSGKWAY
ncbi:DUF5686 and carboxypeptidase regulatory-like domain-containing protein [Portibacter lacus]|uniref:Carboxypeptidase-like regulatory domain-containing protein n=1 Tax=Portibacter lacus TaxID=1099794 RepID=A0AA37SP34_9BACT|nr:DUF5686 and carboxypeptidase regulatory-like domain-containing protein [Portibacter lacus]GLR17372.1 hypothetical protein GCM10007940_19870 [Portibacter lacus]